MQVEGSNHDFAKWSLNVSMQRFSWLEMMFWVGFRDDAAYFLDPFS